MPPRGPIPANVQVAATLESYFTIRRPQGMRRQKVRSNVVKPRKREVKDVADIARILAHCTTVRIGMFDGTRPYVVPMSFGMEVVSGLPVIYFHCGKVGRKVEVVRSYPEVCVEADIFYGYEQVKLGIDTRYESLIGFGTCSLVEGDERIHGLELLCEHCGYAGHPVDVCLGLPITNVFKIEIESLTAKRTLPKLWAQGDPA